MNVTSYPNAAAFLKRAQPALEADEARNSLMLGVCLRLARQAAQAGKGEGEAHDAGAAPAAEAERPFLATVGDADRLLLAVMHTPPHHLVLAALDDAAAAAIAPLADDLGARGLKLPGVLAPAKLARAFAERWAAGANSAFHLQMHQRLHVLHEVKPLPEASGRLRIAAAGDVDLITGWVRAFQMEALDESGDEGKTREMVAGRVDAGDYVLWEDGRPVSMALRTRPTRHGVSVTAVYTPPALRGRGYATACVAALSRRLLDAGYDFCALYTDLSNPTSNRIYHRIGYRPLADFNLYRFDAP